MSLRNQFFVSVLAALFASLSFLGAVASWHARLSVENEMRAALSVANHIVESALSSPQYDLSHLVHSFDGDRHIRAQFRSDATIVEESAPAIPQDVPDWFQRMLQIPSQTKLFTAASGGEIILQTDPANEIGEAWNQFRDGAIILALFGLLVVGLLQLLMARTTAPLNKLAAGFNAVGSGNYGTRVKPSGPSEVSRLAEAFNRMTERLGKLEDANRNLNRQMLNIQEEERADLARDLHDEMGPFLFATRVEAESIGAQAQAAGLTAIAARARAIGEAITHIQQHVRLILKQLRPGDMDEVGLAQAISNLAAFWQRSHVGVKIHLDASGVSDSCGERINSALYRLVQESLTNAVRHGSAREVSVTISKTEGAIHVHIADNGIGLPDRTEAGMGLRGMQERIDALGGTLVVGNRTDGQGAVIDAVIPQSEHAFAGMTGVTE